MAYIQIQIQLENQTRLRKSIKRNCIITKSYRTWLLFLFANSKNNFIFAPKLCLTLKLKNMNYLDYINSIPMYQEGGSTPNP